ncbi:ABC transporter ATP-binding protein [Streptomyces anulatus]|uniref:ABC transporter ATP-binding protein n=1 Tax=Streptomyces anulatus TaxID=1892 RepID=UPI00225416D6|nr:ABC transporter ATP-binding protein [Streptomyces anulatus]MCX4518377.1 ABC transporter ATP-binding protein [Streptomyces anulatus]
MRLRRDKRHTAGDRPAPGAAAPGPAVELRGVRRQYGRGAGAVHALAGLDLALPRGTFTAIMGPSGSGKSTFLQCAAGLDRPSAGSVRLGGTEITGMNENELTELRRSRLGFVFQAFNLLPSLTVEQNVLLPLRLDGKRQDRRRAAAVLAQVGLGDKARRRPGELSGGQQQRVAVARAVSRCAARARPASWPPPTPVPTLVGWPPRSPPSCSPWPSPRRSSSCTRARATSRTGNCARASPRTMW